MGQFYCILAIIKDILKFAQTICLRLIMLFMFNHIEYIVNDNSPD